MRLKSFWKKALLRKVSHLGEILVVTDDTIKDIWLSITHEKVNQYTTLDKFPVPRIDDIINRVTNYQLFSTIGLKTAYRSFTVFKVYRKLFQIRHIHLGVTNAIPVSQRKIIDCENFAWYWDISRWHNCRWKRARRTWWQYKYSHGSSIKVKSNQYGNI